MPFQKDDRLAHDAGTVFGEYVESFRSKNDQVRADLFRKGRVVVAHVSFASGLDANTVTDPYMSPLWDYAREHGWQDQFKLVLS